MLNGIVVPIPKKRWAKLSSFDMFRVITHHSILFKVIDVIVITKEKDNVYTCNIQFIYKHGASVTLCIGRYDARDHIILCL